jgi:serine/threonine protein kinase
MFQAISQFISRFIPGSFQPNLGPENSVQSKRSIDRANECTTFKMRSDTEKGEVEDPKLSFFFRSVFEKTHDSFPSLPSFVTRDFQIWSRKESKVKSKTFYILESSLDSHSADAAANPAVQLIDGRPKYSAEGIKGYVVLTPKKTLDNDLSQFSADKFAIFLEAETLGIAPKRKIIVEDTSGSKNSDGCNLLLLKYANGGDLSNFLTFNEEISLGKKLEICRQVCSIITNLHKNLIFHRDIKPENFLVHENTSLIIKITDFGYSTKELDSNKKCYSDNYFPPEYYPALGLGPKDQDQLIISTRHHDLWCLGSTLFFIITGQLYEMTLRNKCREYKRSFSYNPSNFIAMQKLSDAMIDEYCKFAENEFITHEGIAFILKKLLQLNSRLRIEAQEAFERFESIQL